MKHIPKPQAGEFAPYAAMYNDLIPDDGQVLQLLADNFEKVKRTIQPLSEEQLVTPCAAGEWTIKEILVHIIDDERIYAYRALRFARNDSVELPGFEQDPYVDYSAANERTLDSIWEEYAAVRQATITLFKNLTDDTWLRQGIASGNPMSVRAAVYHIAGHELHHLNSIQENYLS